MNRKIKRYAGYGTAMVFGMLAFCFVASSQADNADKRVTICYRGNTLVVDRGALNYYIKLGATIGACSTSP